MRVRVAGIFTREGEGGPEMLVVRHEKEGRTYYLLPGGGVVICDRSRAPINAMCNVRGMGVALIAKTSTLARIVRIFSFCTTPKRCSSSMINKPSSSNCTSFESNRCVPMITSTSPAASFLSVSRCSRGD